MTGWAISSPEAASRKAQAPFASRDRAVFATLITTVVAATCVGHRRSGSEAA
ncbi:hypothetical protein [Sphingomonas sp. RS2018]